MLFEVAAKPGSEQPTAIVALPAVVYATRGLLSCISVIQRMHVNDG